MTQATTWQLAANSAGLLLRQRLNQNLNVLATAHKGPAIPSYVTDVGTIWCDDSADPVWTYKVYLGGTVTNAANWRTLYSVVRTTGDILAGTISTGFFGNATGFQVKAGGGVLVTNSHGYSLAMSRIGSDGALMECWRGGVLVGTISVTTTSTAYNTTSDYRLPWKEGAVPVEDSGAFIDALKPMFFPEVGHAGFIAHEFQAVSPSSVVGEKDAVDVDGTPIYQSMQASSADVMAHMVAELQSLRRRVAELEAAFASALEAA